MVNPVFRLPAWLPAFLSLFAGTLDTFLRWELSEGEGEGRKSHKLYRNNM